MSVQFDDFLPGVMPMVAGCPNGIAIHAVRNACRDFCEFTRYWQDSLASIDAVANQQIYTLIAPSGTNISAVTGVVFDGNDLREAGGAASAVQKDSKSRDATHYFIEIIGGSVMLRPYPTVDRDLAGAFVVSVALKPAMTATGVGDRVYVDYQETIVAGALERLLKMRGHPWFNAALSVDMGHDFRRGRDEAMVFVSKGFSNQSLRVKPRPFA